MSRKATTTTKSTDQLTSLSQHIFVTLITQPDGTTKSVMSAQPLSDTSIRINTRHNRHVLLALMALSCLHKTGEDNNPYFQLSVIRQLLRYRNTAPEVWSNVFEFVLPGAAVGTGEYALSIRQPSFFRQIEMDPGIVVDAAMRGQEDMVMNILNADPSYLLKKAKVKNSVDVEYNVTPLQAAIMANDVQLIERMKEHFARLTTDLQGNPIDGLAEMHNQIKEIYTKSLDCYLDCYLDKQTEILEKLEKEKLVLLQKLNQNSVLTAEQTKQYEAFEEKIKRVTRSIIIRKTALKQDDIHKIIEAHNQVQEYNAFDFQPYVDAICNASQTELDDVMTLINASTPEETQAAIAKTGVSPTQTDEACAKSFDQLTLVEKLNRFREALVARMQQEIIFNPNHILKGLKQNERIWDEVNASRVADPNDHKRTVIFSQLIGWAQRKAAEPVKQDIRQGTGFLTKQNEPRRRQSRFNDSGRNDYPDVALVKSSVIDGFGYKFAAGWLLTGRGWGSAHSWYFFQNLCRAKTASFQNLLRGLCKPERSCVVS